MDTQEEEASVLTGQQAIDCRAHWTLQLYMLRPLSSYPILYIALFSDILSIFFLFPFFFPCR